MKLKALAEGLRFGSGYYGESHCPKCWALRGITNQLRTEPHHNATGVFALVCDACGFYLVL